MAHLDHDKSRYDTKMRQVSTYLRFVNADADLQHKVEQFYAFRFSNKTMFEDHHIVNELPSKLRTELVLTRFRQLIERVPFFAGEIKLHLQADPRTLTLLLHTSLC